MNKKTIIAIVVVVVLFAGYLLYKAAYEPAPTPATNSTSSAEKNTVVLSDAGYAPSTLTIKQGETVTFKNESSKMMWTASAMHPAHTGYSGTSLQDHCPDTTSTSFDACRGYAPGESWSFTFQKVGSWGYHNHLSPKEWGTVVVQ